jgi:hypothetical protein
MKYIILASLVSLFSLNVVAQVGEKASVTCCPLGTRCGGKINCPGSEDRNSRKEIRQAKRASKRNKGAAGKKT